MPIIMMLIGVGIFGLGLSKLNEIKKDENLPPKPSAIEVDPLVPVGSPKIADAPTI